MHSINDNAIATRSSVRKLFNTKLFMTFMKAHPAQKIFITTSTIYSSLSASSICGLYLAEIPFIHCIDEAYNLCQPLNTTWARDLCTFSVYLMGKSRENRRSKA